MTDSEFWGWLLLGAFAAAGLLIWIAESIIEFLKTLDNEMH